MSTLSMHDPRGRFLLTALAKIFDQISPEDHVISLLVGTRSPIGEEIHYYLIAGRPDVQRMLMMPDTPEAAQARELLAAASIRLDAPPTPGEIGDSDTPT